MKLEVLHCQASAAPIPGRPPLLFIHGSFCGAWVWAEHFMPYFARAGYPCEAVSLRGHGASEGHAALAEASLADFLDDAESALRQMSAPPVVVGHSMGGAVAQYLASRQPVAGLALLGSVPPSGLAATMLHMSAVAHDLMWQIGLLQSLGPQSVDAWVVHRAIFAADTPASLGQSYLPRLQDESQRVSLDLMGWLRPPLPDPLPPVLVAGGDADAFVPTSALRETASYWNGELSILPGVPHGLMLDPCWPNVAAVLLDWLQRTFP